jgi:hypothetical protein
MANAEAVCRRLYTDIEANKVRSPADYARLLPQIAATEQASLAELAKIVPPRSQTAAWERFLQRIQQQAEGLVKLGGEAQTGTSIARDPFLLTINHVIEHRRAAARRAGFKYCALV